TALMEACMNGFTSIVTLLFKSGADVNIKTTVNGTALYFAANDGFVDVVKLLLEYDADPTIEVEISTMHDDYTQSAIQVAYKNGHDEVVKLLQKNLT
ncbi:MAG: ankyrin repeat domain-containing protein, partial [Candidatus Hodarchaeales archaeon]